MRIIVCLKPVPEPRQWHRLMLDPETRTLLREGIPATVNPLDKHALEAALRLREGMGGEIIILSMAPRDTIPVLKEALAMGADRAVLLSDRAFAGSDTLGTAYVLSQAVRSLGEYDVILCGNETIDGGTAQVSAQVAEFLEVPNLMHVSGIEAAREGPFQVKTRIERGYRAIEIDPPMVLSVVKEVNVPRYVTMMNSLEAEDKEIRVWSSNDLDLTEPIVGLENSPTRMADLFLPEKRRKAQLLEQDAEGQARVLADRLHRLGFC
jgi:electron transfer flavoprotein beta subunit